MFIPQQLPSSVPTASSLSTALARTANGAVVRTTGQNTPGDGGGADYIYRKSGRGLVTLGQFFLAGPGTDDYWEATERSRADIRRFNISEENTPTQNREALQEALNSARLVLIPNGTDFSIDGPVTLPDDTVLKGEGTNCIIRCTEGDINYLVAGNNCQIEALHLIGPNTGANTVFLNGGGISISNKANVVVSDCFIEQFDVQGVLVYNGNNVTIKNNVFFRNNYAAVSSCDINVYLTTTGGRTIIDGNYCLSNNSHGITLSGAGDRANTIAVNNICVTLDPITCVTSTPSVAFSADAGTDTFTAVGHGLLDDQIVRLTGSDLPGGFSEGTDYYVVNKTDDTFQLSTSLGGSAKDAEDAGSGDMTFALRPWQEIAPSRLERRHGILVGYSNTIEDCLISNNILQNLNWCGIYKDGLSDGPMLISDNICRNIGYANAGNESCIFLTACGGEVIANNICEDFQNVTRGAIYITSLDNNTEPVTVVGNTVRNSAGHGVYIVNKASFVKLTDNTFINNAKSDIVVGTTGSIQEIGGHNIEGNTCHRNNASFPSMLIDCGDSTRITTITRNKLRGYSNELPADFNFNAGIYKYNSNVNVRISDNDIDGYYFGIYHTAYWTGRVTHYDISFNRISNCYSGVSLGAGTQNVSVLLNQNLFVDCDNDFLPAVGYNAGYNGIVQDGLFIGTGTAPPTSGSWVKGDYYRNTDPTPVGAKGWFCSVDGGPGTWLVDNVIADGVQKYGDEDVELSLDRRKTILFTEELTADRTVLLTPDSEVLEGDTITIRREGGGSFSLLVDSFAALDRDEWIKLKHDGLGFILDSSSTPLTRVFNSIVGLSELEVWLNGDANADTTGDADDVQGNHNATWVGTPGYGAAPSRGSAGSKSFALDGTNLLTLPSAAGEYTDDFSFAMWLKIDESATQGAIFYKNDDPTPGGTGPSYGLSFGSGKFAFRDGSGGLFETPEVVETGTWMHVAVVVNGDESQIYVDGVSRLTFDPTVLSNTLLLRIGRYSPTDSLYFDGDISDFMIFSKALLPHEVKALAIGP